MVLRCRAWGRCLRACCLIGIFSCQVGSICEGTHSTNDLPAQSGQTGGVAAYGPNGGTRGGESYKSGVTLILRWASTPSGSTEPRLRGL